MSLGIQIIPTFCNTSRMSSLIHRTQMQAASRRAARREAGAWERRAAERDWETADCERQAAEKDWEAAKLGTFSQKEADEWEAVQLAVLDIEMATEGVAAFGMIAGTAMDSCVMTTWQAADAEEKQRQCCDRDK